MNDTARGVKCGKCSTFGTPAYHDTVAAVRACFGQPAPGSVAEQAQEFERPEWSTRLQRQSTGNAAVRRSLAIGFDADRRQREFDAIEHEREAADVIRAEAAKRVARYASEAPLAEVPAGHYAIEGSDGTLKFYRVDRPTEGRWAGWVFVSVQASDELHPIKNRATKAQILAEISKDWKAAGARYGREIGRCYRCHRTLTDETSRALGIGPDCRSK
jgi:hypothetical protein